MIQETIEAPAESCATRARQSMAEHGIADTPQNFSVWYSHHSGTHPELTRSIDILLSNHCEFTDEINDDIFERFLGSVHENEIIRQTAQHVLSALDALMHYISEVSAQASSYTKTLAGLSSEVVDGKPLCELLPALISETQTISQQSQILEQRLASSSSVIRQLRRNLEDVEREASTDPLTGIANRKCFDKTLRQAAMDMMETGDDLCLLLVDIDHFKHFNDEWGHQTGDEVLKLVAKLLAANLREKDLAARYGGEEFAAVLPNAALGEALAIAERLRETLEAKTLIERETGRQIGNITASIGAALFEPGESLTSLIGRADEALYAAKRGGRNRVTAASCRA